ncbi:hypothetical protein [Aquimarina litoralis]|uniref:hypothetical protein n=1 Tax=Aquimarina litoralis TaxID=584605 RepID=UPI001C58CBF9|nr:hypothetical protein [Aquimarina litoralis]MBW1297177.1 hypothetical protein [Aquimarina litoralis]
MKFLALFITLFFVNISSTSDITEVRSLYRYAKDTKENTEKFYKVTQNTDYQGNPVLSAYYGCALTLKAAYADRTGQKISFFRKGKKLIEAAIEAEPDNIELRMIRLSVQTSAPRITRYYKNKDEDKSFLTDNIEKVSSAKLKKFIKGFMSTSEAFK